MTATSTSPGPADWGHHLRGEVPGLQHCMTFSRNTGSVLAPSKASDKICSPLSVLCFWSSTCFARLPRYGWHCGLWYRCWSVFHRYWFGVYCADGALRHVNTWQPSGGRITWLDPSFCCVGSPRTITLWSYDLQHSTVLVESYAAVPLSAPWSRFRFHSWKTTWCAPWRMTLDFWLA